MIYFVQFDSGSVKIGTTKDLQVRLWQLASERGTEVSLLATLPGGRKEERELHARFAHLRLGRTEQFKPAKDLMNFIGKPSLVSANPDIVEVQSATFEATTIRLTEAQRSVLDRLGVLWGPVAPLSRNQVVAELIRRAEAEVLKKQEKRR